VTPNTGFKVIVLFKGDCLKNGAFWRESYYRTEGKGTPDPNFMVTVLYTLHRGSEKQCISDKVIL